MEAIFTIFAKLFMLVVWGVFITNFIQPFPGITHIALNVMAIFTIFMHGLQSLLFSGNALGPDVQLTRWEKISIFIFGTFALIDIKNKYFK
ncbi:DUF1145 domain-containing protein [Vibrio sp. S11_S32]|uniref:DUF1145 domain-containing protein n=1 Tax=Vibrio sp. S11_S32 TaxID=2720225 RepID=UPI00168119C3|nr:DUF1145 domain-containing protein [Vibrio sp. S11_S32]MBD1576445.1 DUF1145 domain-containing protein [Vibrio sp. S11_S32]